jgi:hypothetical protein
MASQVTNSEFLADSARRYSMSMSIRGIPSRTEVDRKAERQSILAVAPSFNTEELPVAEGAKSLRLLADETPAPVVERALKKFVEGVVSSYDDVSVQCDLRLEDNKVTIQLPRPLFPESIRYGLPIRLEMIDDNGIRRPSVTIREIDPKDVADISREFDAILEAL